VAIILTDLLIGIFIGSLVSIFFLLRSNYHNAFFIENTKIFKGETIRLELSNEVSFFNKASIKNSLWNVPQNSNVIIDATFSSYIDHDILEIFEDFKTTFAEENNINVSIIGLKDKYSAGKELDFVREDIEESKERSTPQEILDYLKEGNSRYVDGKLVSRRLRNKELMDFINSPPLATVVNCIDLREPLNVMMNTGIGDLIPIRAAGNLVDSHIIKSIEIACKQQGARFILLMGNSSNKIYLKALNEYMQNGYKDPDSLIAEALKAQQIPNKFEEKDLHTYADLITRWSVKESQKRILKENPYLRERISLGKLGLATAFFNRENGKIEFSELYDSATVS
jgi:carbonic anhydrase